MLTAPAPHCLKLSLPFHGWIFQYCALLAAFLPHKVPAACFTLQGCWQSYSASMPGSGKHHYFLYRSSLSGSQGCPQDAGILSDGESPAAKRVRREPDSSSDCSGIGSESLPLLPVPQTPEEAAAASREQVSHCRQHP